MLTLAVVLVSIGVWGLATVALVLFMKGAHR